MLAALSTSSSLRSPYFFPKQDSPTMADVDDNYNFDGDHRHHHPQRSSPSCTKLECIRLVQEFSAKFVLEVVGGGGAIWGFSEVLGLRTTENRDLWRTIAMCIAFLFFLRWSRQLRSKYLLLSSSSSSSSSSLNALDQRKNNMDDNGHSLELDEIDGLFLQTESLESTALTPPKLSHKISQY